MRRQSWDEDYEGWSNQTVKQKVKKRPIVLQQADIDEFNEWFDSTFGKQETSYTRTLCFAAWEAARTHEIWISRNKGNS